HPAPADAPELNTILDHELCHMRRRDNLAGAIHMVVELIFWFHPLVWWIGANLIQERERACDEEVLRLGADPRVYADGILKVCRFSLEALPRVAGVSGPNSNSRIRAIMTAHRAHGLTSAKKLILALTSVAAVAGPILTGVLSAPRGHA